MVPGNEEDVEIAFREALANAVIHGNHEDPGKQVYVGCRGGTDEVSIVIRDEGQGFDSGNVPDSNRSGKYQVQPWPWNLPDEKPDG